MIDIWGISILYILTSKAKGGQELVFRKWFREVLIQSGRNIGTYKMIMK